MRPRWRASKVKNDLINRFHRVLALVDQDVNGSFAPERCSGTSVSQEMRGERNDLGMLQRITAELSPTGA